EHGAEYADRSEGAQQHAAVHLRTRAEMARIARPEDEEARHPDADDRHGAGEEREGNALRDAQEVQPASDHDGEPTGSGEHYEIGNQKDRDNQVFTLECSTTPQSR